MIRTIERIRTNKIKRRKCGDIIDSIDVHDFKWCSCGAVAVDGGYVIYPRKEDLIKFYNYVKSFYDINKSNLIQNNELNELKKSLLPLLMNGQIKIED